MAKPKGIHNAAYMKNDAIIQAEYMKVVKNENRMPSQVEISKACKLSPQTINAHLNNIDLKELVQPFKLFGSSVLKGLKDKAEEGDSAAARLYFFLVFDKVERKEVKAEVKADVKVKSNVEVKHKLSPKIAKMLGDALVEEKEEARLKALSKSNERTRDTT